MKEYYIKSLQKIKKLGIILSISQYNQIAKKHNLLSAESLKYISKKSFQKLNKEIIKEVA